jgi:hypothetical protein
MQSRSGSTRLEEPFGRTLARNLTIAAVAGLAFALQRADLTMLLPAAALALWFSLGGHYVELAFLNGIRPRVPDGRLTRALVRLLVWACGGVLLYAGAAATALALPIARPPLRLWWLGSVLFIGLEIVVHATLAVRRRPNFYDGRG